MVGRARDGINSGEYDEGEATNMDTWLTVTGRGTLSTPGSGRSFFGRDVLHEVSVPPPSINPRLMYRRERVFDALGKPESSMYPHDTMCVQPKPLSFYHLHFKFHLKRDRRSVAVVSKFVEEMEFGDRMGRSDCDAIRFTLDVYPELRVYEYDDLRISCDLVQRLTNKRCPLLSNGRLVSNIPGECFVDASFVDASNEVEFHCGSVVAQLCIREGRGKCPCSCSGWVSDPDDAKDADSSMFQNFDLMETLCTCDWAREEWKEFRLMDCELFFEESRYIEWRGDCTANYQLQNMNEFDFI